MTKRKSPPVRRASAGTGTEASLYERIGAEKLERLVAAFYARVDSDPVIRPFYGKTLTCAIHALTDFMTTWLGGPSVYDLRGARLRRRHAPFAIDVQARDAWLGNMKAAVREVGIPAVEANLLLAHLEFAAGALVNTGETPDKAPCPSQADRFDARLAEQWNRLTEAEILFDAVSHGDLALLRSMLPMRLIPHAVLMSHALALWLDPGRRADRRFGHRPTKIKPLEVIEVLLEHRDLDCGPDVGDDLGRFRHLQAMMEAYAGVLRMTGPDWPCHAVFREATRDRFIAEIERDRSSVRLLGLRGQTLLHDAALVGEAELAAVLVRLGTEPDAREAEGHTPLYRASSGEVARVLLAARANADVATGPTRGTPLHQAARRGYVSVAEALLDHGATIDARDAKGETPLRRAVNCRQLDIVQLLVQRGADRHAADRRGVTPLDAARAAEMKQALTNGGTMQTIYEAAGGRDGLLRLASAWHARVLEDEVVSHAFSHGFHPQHTERLAAYWAEALGGPKTYSDQYGNETAVVRMHSGNGPHEEMDQRAIACFDQALHDVGLASDERLRRVLHDYFAWATTITMSHYHHSADDVPDGLPIPKWSWHGLVSGAAP